MHIVSELQSAVRNAMLDTGVSMSDAAEPLGYANKSSVHRALHKDRFSVEDVLKLMVLTKTQSLSVPGFSIESGLVTTQQVDIFLEEMKPSILKEGSEDMERRYLHGNVPWSAIAEIAGYSSGKIARKSWLYMQTPLYLLISVMVGIDTQNHIVKTSVGTVSFRLE